MGDGLFNKPLGLRDCILGRSARLLLDLSSDLRQNVGEERFLDRLVLGPAFDQTDDLAWTSMLCSRLHRDHRGKTVGRVLVNTRIALQLLSNVKDDLIEDGIHFFLGYGRSCLEISPSLVHHISNHAVNRLFNRFLCTISLLSQGLYHDLLFMSDFFLLDS